MTDHRERLTHHEIELTMTRGEWEMLGFCERDGKILRYAYAPHIEKYAVNSALVLAAASDHPAAAFVEIMEARRQSSQVCQAIRQLAESIQYHGSAIERREVAEVLEGIMRQLTERTQFAIRAQLKGTGVLTA